MNSSPWAQFPAPATSFVLSASWSRWQLLAGSPTPLIVSWDLRDGGEKDKKEVGEVEAWSPLLLPSHCPSQTGLNSGLLIQPFLPSHLVPHL